MTEHNINTIRQEIANRAVNHIRECERTHNNVYFIFQSFTGCYSDDTEILTKDRGWILFKDLTYDDEVACLSPKTNTMYWHKPLAIQKYYHKGEMIKIDHRSINLLVTPNHNLYTKGYFQKEYKLIKAKDIKLKTYKFIDSVNWEGEDSNYIIIGNKIFKTKHFLDFLGWYISDGNINHSGKSHSIFIKQIKKHNHSKIIDMLNNLNVNWSLYNNERFYFSSIDLHKYLSKLGKTKDKHIPEEFMNLNKNLLKILFDSLLLGDGHTKKDGQKSYTTISKKLADQLQEIAIKLGFNSTLIKRNRGRIFFKKENRYIDSSVCYDISFRKRKERVLYNNKIEHNKIRNNFFIVNYNDMVYCCTVPEHVILVRRKGRPTWCGNSGKTHSVMKAIDEAGFNWMYFAPFHDVIKENLEYSKLRNYNFIHMKGKEQDGVCFSKDYRKYAKMGLSITPFCESRCPYRHSGCPYYEVKAEIESFPRSWAGVHAHIPTYLQTFLYNTEYNSRMMYNYFDVIIIDEFPTQTLFNQVVVQRSDIDKLREVLSHMEEDSDEKYFLKTFLDELTLASGNIEVNYIKLKSILDNHRGLNWKDFLHYYKNILLDLVSHKIVQKPPKNIVFNLSLIHQENPSLDRLRWMIYKHLYDGWSPPGLYITTSNIKYFKDLPIPVIALDATAELNAWNTLLNDRCESLQIDMEYKNLYQLRSKGRYPVSTWIDIKDNKKILSKSGDRLCSLIKQICTEKRNAVLLCSNKRIKNMITKYLDKNFDKNNYMFAIYYNLRSRNEYYETCDTCVVTHEPNIPPLQLNIMSNVIGWNTDLIKELMTTSEIKQAIGRIRQNIHETPSGRIRDDVEVYVLPGALKEQDKILPEAKLIDFRTLMTGETLTLNDYLADAIKKAKLTNLTAIRNYIANDTDANISFSSIKSALKDLYIKKYITNYKGNIRWIFDEEARRKIKYNIKPN